MKFPCAKPNLIILRIEMQESHVVLRRIRLQNRLLSSAVPGNPLLVYRGTRQSAIRVLSTNIHTFTFL